jgi:transcriptional regulator with XRE-family HTH domain
MFALQMTSRIGQKHPKGTAWPVDEQTRKLIRDRMTERGISQSDLARAIGLTTAGMSMFFTGKSKHSRVLPQIFAVLDLPLPPFHIETVDDAAVALAEILMLLTPEQRDRMMLQAQETAELNALLAEKKKR